MRRFATWTTGHRKTVIFGWIAALIVIGGHRRLGRRRLLRRIQTAGVRLQRSLRTARNEVPGAVGRHGDDRLQGRSRRRIAGGQEEDGRRLQAEIEEVPHVTEVASPYEEGGAAAVSDDGKIAYATIQYDVPNNKLEQRQDRAKSSRSPRALGGNGLEVQLGGQPVQEAEAGRRRLLVRDRAAGGDRHPAASPSARWWRWACRSSPRCSRSGSGSAWSRSAPTSSTPRTSRPILAAMIGLGVGIDYALFILTRFRNGLDEGLRAAAGGDQSRRHRRPRRPLRRDHGDHRPDGDVPARASTSSTASRWPRRWRSCSR